MKKPNKIILVQTSEFYPEQYDAFAGANRVGYLRLRSGRFTVNCPWVGGEKVYEAYPKGEGQFEKDEREYYLFAAKQAICNWINKKPTT